MSLKESSTVLILAVLISLTSLSLQKSKDRLIFFYSIKDPYHEDSLGQFLKLKPKLLKKRASSLSVEMRIIENEKVLSQRFNIFKSPTIILYKHNGKYIEYEGNLEIEEFSRFLRTYIK
jgi:adenylate kinase family enzyme